jgi:ribosomal protein S18 acetylase RimI-like enzyme
VVERADRLRVYREVARLHRDNLDQGFLATLGERFLALMYRAIDETAGAALLVEERDGQVLGFVSGARGMRAIYRRMLSHPVELALALLPSLLRPARVWRILEILRYGGKADAIADLPPDELLSIAVSPLARGSGVAERLYQRLQAHFRERGVAVFRITVGDALEPAHRFYRRMGARPVGRVEVHRGQGSVVYLQDVARA